MARAGRRHVARVCAAVHPAGDDTLEGPRRNRSGRRRRVLTESQAVRPCALALSHKLYLNAPKLCLAAFDELKEIGLDAFTKKHAPYWDILLNGSLPQPVIELPIPTTDD
jgi:hypothetical protein